MGTLNHTDSSPRTEVAAPPPIVAAVTLNDIANYLEAHGKARYYYYRPRTGQACLVGAYWLLTDPNAEKHIERNNGEALQYIPGSWWLSQRGSAVPRQIRKLAAKHGHNGPAHMWSDSMTTKQAIDALREADPQ